ncbi:MAG: helix-turn-helix transcriptional regulator [Chloroflexi bacterium]|nr:helix-turn-helix transcriptional regulator [Chloroflexota bacterium]
MDDIRQGRICRALRLRARLTQKQLGRACGISQQAVSLVERGHGSRLSGLTMRRLFAALDARWEPTVSWRGGELDRLLDERHARLGGTFADLLRRRGWRVDVEVTYAKYAERGSIDILAWWPAGRIALVVEIKSELVSVEATIRKLDEKVRLSIESIAETRFGERPRSVARLLVLPASTTDRRRVARAHAILGAALPVRSDAVRAWLRSPAGAIRGLLFVADTNRRGLWRGG